MCLKGRATEAERKEEGDRNVSLNGQWSGLVGKPRVQSRPPTLSAVVQVLPKHISRDLDRRLSSEHFAVIWDVSTTNGGLTCQCQLLCSYQYMNYTKKFFFYFILSGDA